MKEVFVKLEGDELDRLAMPIFSVMHMHTMGSQDPDISEKTFLAGLYALGCFIDSAGGELNINGTLMEELPMLCHAIKISREARSGGSPWQ